MSYTINTLYSFGQPRVTYSGLASGLNTGSIVNNEVAAASQNQTLLFNSAATDTLQASLYANVAGQLGTLDGIMAGLSNAGLFAPSSGTSSDASSVAITPSTTAQTGTYAVSVTQLAQGQINNSANFASATSTVASASSGSVTLAVGSGPATTFDLTASTTLSDLANAINGSGLAVTATVVNDANGYHISLASTGTGASSALTVSEVNSQTAFDSNLVQSAQNAAGTVNGAAFSVETNTTSSLISGVTTTFKGLTSSPVTVQISKDTTSLTNTLQSFVAQYNAVVSSINTANPTSDIGLQNLTAELTHAVTSAPASASGTYHTLADIGISMAADGTLAIDSTALSKAINTDATSVANLLADTSTGAGMASTVDATAVTYGAPAGILTQLSQAETTQAAHKTAAAQGMQYGIDVQTATLQNNFVNLEVTMANLDTQNKIVEAFASSAGPLNNPQNATQNGQSDNAPSTATAANTNATAPTPTTDVTAIWNQALSEQGNSGSSP
jgi:flagellar hook-associated protein 2